MKTKTSSVLTLALCIALVVVPDALRAEERMRAGLWEVTMAEGGAPAGAGRTTCYTPAMVDFANSPAKTMREATEKTTARRGCALKDFKMDGNTISMVKTCGTKSSAISSVYSGTTFETVDTTTEAGVTKVIRMKGRRIGECK